MTVTASIQPVGPALARISPGKMSLARFEREAAPLGVRKRVNGWRIWAQPLALEPDHLYPRVEGGVATTKGEPVVWITVADRLVTIRTPDGAPVVVPALLATALVTRVLQAIPQAVGFLEQFSAALDAAAGSHNRRIRGAAVQARRLLRLGHRLTPGLMRNVWEAVDPLFGEACQAVADRTRVNPGRVRTIITADSYWWAHRTPDAPHWLEGLSALTGYPWYMVRAVTFTNRWWHHRRRRRGSLKAWRDPHKHRNSGAVIKARVAA